MQPWYAQHIYGGPLITGAVIALAGVVALYLAWRHKQRSPLLLLLGWGLLGYSYFHWARGAGVDNGATIGTVVIMLFALVFVAVNGDWRTRQRKRSSSDDGGHSALPVEEPVDPQQTRRTVIRTLAAGPLSFLACLGIAMLFVALPDWREANRIVIGACAMLVVWPIGMVWSCAAVNPRRPAAAFATIIAISVSVLSLVP